MMIALARSSPPKKKKKKNYRDAVTAIAGGAVLLQEYFKYTKLSTGE